MTAKHGSSTDASNPASQPAPDPYGILETVVVPPGLFWAVASIMLTIFALAAVTNAFVGALLSESDVPTRAVTTLAGSVAGAIAISICNCLLLLGIRGGHRSVRVLVGVASLASVVAVVATVLQRTSLVAALCALVLSATAWRIVNGENVRLCAAFCILRRDRQRAQRRAIAEALASKRHR